MKNLFIASDHAGYALKNELIERLKERFAGYVWHDLGPENDERVDYPDFADKVALKVNKGEGVGLLICGSGQGMCMRANRYPNVRAALGWNEESCILSRSHNDANILCLGARLLDSHTCEKLIELFLHTKFEGGRHSQRTEKLRNKIG